MPVDARALGDGSRLPEAELGSRLSPRVRGAETLSLEVFPECGELLEPSLLAESLSKLILRFTSHTDHCPPNGRGFKVTFLRRSRTREAVSVRAVCPRPHDHAITLTLHHPTPGTVVRIWRLPPVS